MAIISNTDAAAVIDSLVSSIVQDTLIQESIMLPLVSNESGMAQPGFDRISIPRFSTLTINGKSEEVCDTPQTPTIAVDTLLLNKHKIVSWEIEDITNVQSMVDITAKLVGDSARLMAAQVDNDGLSELIANISVAAPDHALTFADFSGPPTTFSKEMIVEARKLLNVARVPMQDRYMIIDPDSEKDLLLINEFVEADRYGSSQGLVNGELGRLFGFRVVMSTSSAMSAKSALFFHKSALAYAAQAGLKGLERDRNILCKKDQYSMDMLYGWKTLDLGKRAVKITVA